MALNPQPRSRWLLRLHFLVRLIGLTGLLAAGVGLVLAWLLDLLASWETIWQTAQSVWQREALSPVTQWAVWLVLGGGLAVFVALLVEVIVIVRMVAGRRSAFGFNAVAQVALATALLVGVNLYSQRHYLRLDWTQDGRFTLEPDIQRDLRQLKGDKGETTIVVYQLHKTFGRISDKPDATDFAAERKVVEKVYDLVDQLREFGRQFKVVVLDVEEEGFNDALERLTKGEKAQGLRAAIDKAVENTIFFHDGNSGKVQALSFNDFYLLDKTASAERNNLVLRDQGQRAFVNKVLNVDEKRPRIGVLVIHEWLSTEGPEEYGLAGLKKALTARGFDVQDVVLKKWGELGPPEPAVYTIDESKYERLEEELAETDARIKGYEEDLRQIAETARLWRTATLGELTKKYARQLGGRQVTDVMRKRQLEHLDQEAAFHRLLLGQAREERDTLAREKLGLNAEGLAEQRRITDLKAKLNRALAEFDLIVVPRMTLRNVTIGDRIPNRLYRLDEAQVAAVRDYLKSGKPVLACLGPVNDQPDRFDPAAPAGPDGLEDLLTQLGLRLPRQTVLFNVEGKAFAERRSGLLVSGVNVEIPPVDFDWQAGPGPYRIREEVPDLEPHRIRESMRVIARSVGKDPDRRGQPREDKKADDGGDKQPPGRKLDLVLRHPRPVYVDPKKEKELRYDPIFLMTDPASWNDNNPFPSRERTPRYEPPKPDDPAAGTPEENRRGPFPIGVALETPVPGEWYEDKSATLATVRVAVIGHGGWFVGPELSPGKEKLLLNVSNWLLGRDDLLSGEGKRWEYPRVELSPRDKEIWHWGTQLVLPGLFAWLGLAVLLVRRMH